MSKDIFYLSIHMIAIGQVKISMELFDKLILITN